MPLKLYPLQTGHLEQYVHMNSHSFRDSGDVANLAMFPQGVTAGLKQSFLQYQRIAFHETRGVVFMGVFDLPEDYELAHEMPIPNGHGPPKAEQSSSITVTPPVSALIATARMRLEDAITFSTPTQKRTPPPEANAEAYNAFFGMLGKAKADIMGSRTFWVLDQLATATTAQKRGAGRMLVEWMSARADETVGQDGGRGVECFLEATEMGRPLYEKCGYLAERRLAFPATKFGLEEDGVFTMMVRPRREQSSNRHA